MAGSPGNTAPPHHPPFFPPLLSPRPAHSLCCPVQRGSPIPPQTRRVPQRCLLLSTDAPSSPPQALSTLPHAMFPPLLPLLRGSVLFWGDQSQHRQNGTRRHRQTGGKGGRRPKRRGSELGTSQRKRRAGTTTRVRETGAAAQHGLLRTSLCSLQNGKGCEPGEADR